MGEKGDKEEKRTKNRGMMGKKKNDFGVKIMGSFFKSGRGRLSKSMEQYTPLECSKRKHMQRYFQ